MPRSLLAALLALVVVLAPASAAAQEPPPGRTVEGEANGIAVERVAGADRVDTAIAIAELEDAPVPAVVLARADDFADALVGGPLAAHLGAPLLLTRSSRLDDRVAAAIGRLGPERVVLLGGEAALGAAVADALAGDYELERIAGADRYATAAAIARRLQEGDGDAGEDPGGAYVATGEVFADALAVAPLAAHAGRPILLARPGSLPDATAAFLADHAPAEIVVVGGPAAVGDAVVQALDGEGRTVRRVAGAERYATAAAVLDEAESAGMAATTLWLATGQDFPDALAAGPAAGRAAQPLLLVSGSDLCRATAAASALEARRDRIERVRLLGGPAAVTADAVRQLAVVTDPDRPCLRLPRGGTSVFPEFRVVAHYGSHATPRMGILGHGTPDEAGQRLLGQAAAYGAGDRPVLPAMEFIAVIANASPGADGRYRTRVHEAVIREYLEAARRVDALLVLDIQPGHSDFLTELRPYEALLREPDVGVALDPEWRMSAGGVPGDEIGWVHADEVNQVSAYVAGIVAEHDLPEKVFIVHQFRHDMVRERHRIVDRDGLAVTIHADGFGGREIKRKTYDQLAVGPPLFNGFKLFYTQDTNLFAPADVLGFSPTPDYVSYQ